MKNKELAKLDAVVASMTAPGQPFALENVEVAGVEYRNYSTMPANLGAYCQVMLKHADKDFAVYQQERYTFGEAYAQSAAFANALVERLGVRKGDRVAILSRNNPQWMMAFIAITSIGAVAVPMNAWWITEELDYGFEDSGAKIVVADRARIERLAPIADRHGLQVISVDDCSGLGVEHTPFKEVIAGFEQAPMPAVEVAADDHATIMYTSGSTGHPKGALSSHRGILSALYSWILLGMATKAAAGESAPADKFPPAGLMTIPLFHCTASHSVFLMSLAIGRKLVIMHKWDPQEALRLIEEERITWFNGVPTMSAELQAAAADSSRDLSSLVDIMSGGAARPP